MPATRGERRADDEGDRDGAVDIDAEQRRHLRILLAGALRAAERRLGQRDTRSSASTSAVTTQMINLLDTTA